MFAVVPLMIVLMLLSTMMVMLVSFRRLAMVVAMLPLGLIGVVFTLLVFNRPLGFVAILGILRDRHDRTKNAVILIVSIEDRPANGKNRARRGHVLGDLDRSADDADGDVDRARADPDRADRVLGPMALRDHGRPARRDAAHARVPARCSTWRCSAGRPRRTRAGRGRQPMNHRPAVPSCSSTSASCASCCCSARWIPSPFRERDLIRRAEAADYIVDNAREAPRG